jgi:hypothetical protein
MLKNKKSNSLLLLLCVFILSPFLVLKVAKGQTNDKLKDLQNQFDNFSDSLQISASPKKSDDVDNIKFTGVPYYDSLLLNSYTNQYVFNVEHEKRSFKLQFYSSILIFILVVVIVSLGLILSYKQFMLNEYIIKQSIEQNKETIDKGTDTSASLEVGKDGVKINTAVIGLIILVISLVFFFLYLKFVYHIEFVK